MSEVIIPDVEQASDVTEVDGVSAVNYYEKNLAELVRLFEELVADENRMKLSKEAETIKAAFYKRLAKDKAEAGLNSVDVIPDEMPEEETYYTVGTRPPEHCLWDTLPLRKGVHPLYRNLGGLPQGGTISFSVKTMGLLWGEDATVQAEPHLFVVENGTCREVDVYYEEETESGPVLKSWNPEEQRMYLEKEDTGTAIGIWTGTFTLPKKIYVTERGTDVWSYRELYGLSFTESFWITDTPLLLRFALWGENEAGELLYYGMIPEEIVNNIWQTEAKVLSREDYDKRNFQIFGGEIAVIYPGENTSVGQTSQGIY